MVYLLVIILFIPFPFYKDIVAATSGGGNKDVVFREVEEQVQVGRLLHRFPHSKVCSFFSPSPGQSGRQKRGKGRLANEK